MIFEHCNHLGDIELEKKETPGCRLYHLPDGSWVPSITSVTSFYNRQIFINWRKRIGIEEANRITKKATTRGTDFHEAVEVYMRNNEIDWEQFRPATKFMFEMPSEADFEMLYGNLKAQGTISFWSTSFIRGTTLDKAIVIVDEYQNLNFHELDSIITRIGQESKIMFCGDATQSDLVKTNERNGVIDFMQILRIMPSVDIVEFGIEDIVRSGFVKEYLLAKLEKTM